MRFNLMFHRREFLTILFLFFACLAGLVTFHVIVRDGDSMLVWIGVVGGVMSGSFLLGYILRSKQRREQQAQLSMKLPTPNVSYRWLFPSVVGGVVLGAIAIIFLGEEILDALFAFLSTWMLIMFGSFAYFAWQYMPRS